MRDGLVGAQFQRQNAGGRSVGQANSVVHSRHVTLWFEQAHGQLAGSAVDAEGWDLYAEHRTRVAWVVWLQAMDAAEVKMLPPFDLLASLDRAQYDAPGVRRELAQCFLVAMVWLILRYQDHVRFGDVAKRFDA